MDWQRTTMGLLVYDLGGYRDVLERIAAQLTWTARVERRDQTYTSVFEYPPGSCVVIRILDETVCGPHCDQTDLRRAVVEGARTAPRPKPT